MAACLKGTLCTTPGPQVWGPGVHGGGASPHLLGFGGNGARWPGTTMGPKRLIARNSSFNSSLKFAIRLLIRLFNSSFASAGPVLLAGLG